MWSALVERLEAFPDAPVYHYGNYEKKAFATLAKRHGRGSDLAGRLVNVASSVYGKVYFPVRSNGLKQLGRFLGATWTDPQASGLQSLVWRHRWEMTRDERFRQSLLRYNREDCEAVRLLVDRLDQIRRDAASDPTIEFASRPKRHATETGKAVHGQFERILKSARELRSAGNPYPREGYGAGRCPDETGRAKRSSSLLPDRSKGQPHGTRGAQAAMSKRRCGSRAEADEAGREDGRGPRLHEERLQEDGHEVCRDQGPLSKVWGALQSGVNWKASARLWSWPSSLDNLPESCPPTAL